MFCSAVFTEIEKDRKCYLYITEMLKLVSASSSFTMEEFSPESVGRCERYYKKVLFTFSSQLKKVLDSLQFSVASDRK